MSEIIRVNNTPIFDQLARELELRGRKYEDISQFSTPAFVWGPRFSVDVNRETGDLSLVEKKPALPRRQPKRVAKNDDTMSLRIISEPKTDPIPQDIARRQLELYSAISNDTIVANPQPETTLTYDELVAAAEEYEQAYINAEWFAERMRNRTKVPQQPIAADQNVDPKDDVIVFKPFAVQPLSILQSEKSNEE